MNKSINGINLEQLNETVELIQKNPKLGYFKFKAESNWIEGGNTKVQIHKFFAAEIEDKTRPQPFIVEVDEPAILLGTNKSPNPVEYILASLVSCLSVGYAYTAAARGITLNELKFEVEGNIDLCGFLGLSKEIRPGFNDIHISTHIRSDASEKEIQDLSNYVQKTSPVLDIIRNPVKVVFDKKINL